MVALLVLKLSTTPLKIDEEKVAYRTIVMFIHGECIERAYGYRKRSELFSGMLTHVVSERCWDMAIKFVESKTNGYMRRASSN
jgi:uncharacterized membrane protein